jgi:hypothetical protein
MAKVYGWMSFALALTGFVAYFTAQTPALVELLFSNQITIFLLFGAQLGIVILQPAHLFFTRQLRGLCYPVFF